MTQKIVTKNPSFGGIFPIFGEGIDWMMRRIVSVLAQSVIRIFPSGALILNCSIFSDTSIYPSVMSFCLRSDQYFLGSLPVTSSTDIISITENHHSSWCEIFRISFCSKRAIDGEVIRINDYFPFLTSFSISLMSSWFVLRNSRAFSRPCPRRVSP